MNNTKHEIEMEQRETLLEACDPIFFQSMFKISYDQNHKTRVVSNFKNIGETEGLIEKLKTNKNTGLDESNKSDMEWRIKKWGLNSKSDIIDHSYLDHVINAMGDEMLIILLAAAAISLIIGILKDGIQTGWIEGTAIFFAVFIVVNITAYNNSMEEIEFNKLNRLNRQKHVELIRGNKGSIVDTEVLVVGDIVHYKTGDMTDVDTMVVENFGVEIDESSITGESKEIKKQLIFNEKNITVGPLIYSGCAIKKGNCKAVVVCVGENTSSRLAEKDLENTKCTPLQKKLDDLKDDISKVGYYCAILIGIVMVMKEVFLRVYSHQSLFDSSAIDTVVNAFIISITVLVVALPEGLPMAVTLSLVHSMKKMKQENNLVKYVDSSETMGNVNELCSDKTGTLTTGEMILTRVFIMNQDYILDKEESNSLKSVGNHNIKGFYDFNPQLLEFMNLNVIKNMTQYQRIDGKIKVHGSMTDDGYGNFLNKNKYDISRIEAYQANRKDLIKVDFSSDEKFMGSTLYLEKTNKYRILVKGAFDFFRSKNRFGSILKDMKFNSNIYDILEAYSLETMPFETSNLSQVESYIKLASENCLRSIFFGYKDVSKEEYEKSIERNRSEPLKSFTEFLEKDVVLIGLMSFYDPPRDNIQSAIGRCHGAGIKLRMITGDDIRTAVSISYKIKILSDIEYREILTQETLPKEPDNGSEEEKKKYQEKVKKHYVYLNNLAENGKLFCLEGATFNIITGGLRENPTFDKTKDIEDKNQPYELCDSTKFNRITKNLKVIGRCANDNKLLLVFGLKTQGSIVAVTGDGTNDAIALKNSDVGFAMGIRGTDVAKSAADIILLDDSFLSIITAIKYGRNVYDSIRKFVQFQLTTNLVAIFMTLLGGIVLKDAPLNPIQMLWVNLIMDSFASLALATEPPSEDLLKRKPYKKTTDILTKMMKVNIGSQAILQIVILLVVLFFGEMIFGVPSDRELNHYTWNNEVGYHFTIFFNIFVFLQVFNSINSRKLLQKEANIFIGLTNNPMYIGIQLIIIGGQMLLVEFGGRAVRTQPLTLMQHLGCIAIGSTSLVLGYIVKKLPFNFDDEDEEEKIVIKKSKSRLSTISRTISGKTRK